ncbi:EAL domain-containing protein [Aliamphritea spongicola]|uniref:EAL domain-containing protein n=1 Tax=Aliamphritea spongicola TaxID=707589 RepID=UPI00196B2553|nr:EAL domain-containing protein [Aliamphritea spongicola]MBN3561398.1 EAL domain-containing protein [Aliamphritea spongicola]
MSLSPSLLAATIKRRLSFASVTLLLCFSVIWWQASYWFETYLVEERAQQFDQQVDGYAQNLANILNKRFALLQGLTSYVETDLLSSDVTSEGSGQRLDTFINGLLTTSKGIRNFAVAPDGVISKVIPLQGNESALGHDLLSDTRLASRHATLRAMRQSDIALTSPMQLLQGGNGVVARQAVNVDGHFWGLVSMALDMAPLLQESGLLNPETDLQIGIRDSQGVVFYGDDELFSNERLVHRVDLIDGQWELAAMTSAGADADIRQSVMIFEGVLAAFFLLVTGVLTQQRRQYRAQSSSADGNNSTHPAQPGPPTWAAPLLTFCALFMATVALYWFMQRNDTASEQLALNNTAATLEHDIRRRLSSHQEYFELLAEQISQGQLSKTSYQERVSRYVYDHPGLVNVTWADADFVIRDTAPYEENKQVVGLKLLLPEPKRASYEAYVSRQPVYTNPFVVIQGHPAFELYVPIFTGERFLGTLGAVYKIEYLLDGLVPDDVRSRYKVDFVDREGQVIYGDAEQTPLTGLTRVLPISQLNETVWLRLNAYDNRPEQSSRLLLILLLLLATGIGISLWLQYRESRLNWRLGEDLRESQRHFQAIAQSSPMAIIISCPEDGKIIYGNAQAEKLFSCAIDTLHGSQLEGYFSKPEDYRRFCSQIREERHLDNFELLIEKRDAGEKFWASLSSQVALYGNSDAIITSVIDLSERKNHEDKLFEQANYDALTGLPNRGLAFDRLQDAMARAKRQETRIALMMLDLDHFKTVNDNLGHNAGDLLLKEVSRRLTGCIREGDTVARLGGDEFTLILPELKEAMEAELIAEKIIKACSEPVFIRGHEVAVSASIGITVFPDDGEDQEMLLKNADTAMYKCKEDGRNHFHFYTEEMNRHAQALLKMELELRKALQREEFVLHYQPLICTTTGQIMGVEALLRWHNEALGNVAPDVFIPLAESIGVINELGEWVLYQAASRIKAWRQQPGMPQYVAVNVSVQQLRQGRFAELVGKVFQEVDIPPQALELEITETVLLDNTERNHSILNVIDAMGVRLSIDDFGTGYSSLSYLGRFPFDTLKIDRSFINDVDERDEAAQLTSAIISMADILGLRVVAEGVETQKQLDFLGSLNCDLTQGFYLARPMPAAELEAFIADYSPVCSQVVPA